MNIPNELVEQFSKGNGAIFVGAGLSLGAGLPGWGKLIEKLLGELEDCPPNSSYTDIAQYYAIRHGKNRLISRLREELDTFDVQPTPVHRALIELRVSPIFTTNYDDLLEKSLTEAGLRFNPVISTVDASFWTTDRLQLVKFHGDLSQPESVVLTSEDYERYYPEHPALTRLLSIALQTRTLLLLGYSAADNDFRSLLRQVQSESGAYARNAYAVMFDAAPLVIQDMERRGIKVINCTDVPAPDRNAVLSAWLVELKEKIGEHRTLKLGGAPRKKLPSEPYKFLHWFGEEDLAIFHGREYEINRLSSLIETQRLTILYGESGTGKTSLLRAGIVPVLRERGYLISYFRPLLDPFKEAAEALKATLRVPADASLRLDQILSQGLPGDKTLVILLDQFEEFFIRQGFRTRKDFEGALKSLLDLKDKSVRLVFSLRSDYLDRLDELEDILGHDPLRFRVRLHNLGPASASAAILEPARDFSIHLDQTLLEKLVSDLGQGWIAPPQLQIVCYSLWKDWVDRDKPSTGLTLQRYLELGSTEEILSNYLVRVLQDLGDPKALADLSITLPPEIAQNVAKAILKSMITSEKTKIAVSSREITHSELVLHLKTDREQIQAVLRYLQNQRIVRHVPESEYYELVHEVMINQIWGWVTEDERRILDIQDILQRALTDYRRFQTLISPEYLDLIGEHIDRVNFSQDELELLLSSAVHYDYSPARWVERMYPDHAIAVLETLIASGRKVLYPQIASALGFTHSAKAVRYLDELCREESRETQRAAAAAMAKLRFNSVIPPLFHAVMREESLQRAAPFLEALENLHNEDATAMLALAAKNHPDVGVRKRAASAMLRLNKTDGFELLLKQLSSGSDSILDISAGTLAVLFQDRPEEVIQFFEGCEAGTRLKILKGLSGTRNKHIFELLALAVSDESQPVRHEAIVTLGRFEFSEQSARLLVEATQDADPELRALALTSLVQGREEEYPDQIITASQDESVIVRLAAGTMLCKMPGPQAVDGLVSLLNDPDERIRSIVFEELSQRKDEYVATALSEIPAADEARSSADSILHKRQMAEEFENIKLAFTSEDGEARSQAISRLAAMDPEIIRESGLVERLEWLVFNESNKDTQREMQAAVEALKIRLRESSALHQLRSNRKDAKKAAIAALATVRTRKSINALVECLLDKDESIAQSALSSLAEINTEEAVRAVAQLVARDPRVRKEILNSFHKVNQPAKFSFLVAVFQDQGPKLLAQTLVQMRMCSYSLRPLVSEVVLKALSDESAEVRTEAIKSVRALGMAEPRFLDALAELLKKDSRQVRMEAVATLAALKDHRSIDPLMNALEDPEETVRSRALAALEQINDPRTRQILADALENPNQDVRVRAAIERSRQGQDRRATRILIETLNQSKGKATLRREAASCLGFIQDPEAVEALLTAMKDHDSEVQKNAIVALGNLGDARCLEPSLQLLSNKSLKVKVRMRLLNTVSVFDDPRVIAALEVALKDSSLEVRALAETLLADKMNAEH